MLPVQVLDLLGAETLQFRLDVLLVTLLVIRLHPEIQANRRNQDGAASCQVETLHGRNQYAAMMRCEAEISTYVSDMVVRSV